jgi:hypothetical protein
MVPSRVVREFELELEEVVSMVGMESLAIFSGKAVQKAN